jgi:hypothetical protein
MLGIWWRHRCWVYKNSYHGNGRPWHIGELLNVSVIGPENAIEEISHDNRICHVKVLIGIYLAQNHIKYIPHQFKIAQRVN